MQLDKNIFIEEANKIHNNFYKYDKFVYSGKSRVGIITCPKHGDFLQSPSDHLRGHGCLKCYREKQSYSKEKFISMVKDKNPNIDYDKLVYDTYKTKATFYCKLHGEFIQKPLDHYKAEEPCHVCKKIKLSKTLSKDLNTFLEQAKAVHGDTYDYSESEYINSYTKIKIKCKTHGDFYQTANTHLSGSGCPKCSKTSCNKDTETFIRQLKAYRGDEFTYDKVEYVNATTKVIVTCPKHGDKEASPVHLLLKKGPFKCPECLQKSKQENFIERAKAIHGDRYDYSKTLYVKNRERVEIICPKHGSFCQTPNNHLGGSGCSLCNSRSSTELKIDKFFRQNNIEFISEYRLLGSSYRYDFYLPKYNILIEYHGEQHYNPRFYANMKGETFEERQIKDRVKAILAEQHGIPLIIMSYQDHGKVTYLLKRSLNSIYKYKYNDKYFRRLIDLYKHIEETTGRTDVTKEEVEQYRIEKIID